MKLKTRKHRFFPTATLAGLALTTPAAFGATMSFQDGLANAGGVYSDTVDGNPRGGPQGDATLSYGTNVLINIEDDPAQEDGQGLIRFDNIFGAGAGQIPIGSTIISASLEMTTGTGGNASALGGGPTIHQMLMNWDESNANGSWNYFVGGVNIDDTQAAITADDVSLSLVNIADGETVSANVLNSLQAWSAGATNQGWLVMGSDVNRWDIHSSESATALSRPKLIVEFTAPIPEPSTTALLGLGGLALILRRRK